MKASLDYTASSRTARDTHRETLFVARIGRRLGIELSCRVLAWCIRSWFNPQDHNRYGKNPLNGSRLSQLHKMD